MELKISPKMRNEWQVRCIGDVIPALVDYDGAARINVCKNIADEIAADCRFYLDPYGPEASVGERSAYRALLRQIESKQ